MIYQIMNCWDITDKIKLYNNIVLISQRRVNPYQVFNNTISNEIVKSYIKQIYNMKQEGKDDYNQLKNTI